MLLKQINPKLAYYIKLGSNGEWERDCLEVSQTLKLGYREIKDELCRKGKWNKVQEELQKIRESVGAATRDKNQIRMFYEADASVLWTTFFGDRLYWCFSKPEITLLSDGSKTRQVIGQWSHNDVSGKPLYKNQLSGALLRMQGFRGTICIVKEIKYLVQKINSIVSPEVEEARQAKEEFVKKIETLIGKLTWKDFELLIDLLFRQAGWQRAASVGKTEKIIDLDLYSPLTEERLLIQVKSSAGLAKLRDFQIGISDFQYDRAYFIVHTPSEDFAQAEKMEGVEVWLLNDIARRVIIYGLAEWIMNKVQ